MKPNQLQDKRKKYSSFEFESYSSRNFASTPNSKNFFHKYFIQCLQCFYLRNRLSASVLENQSKAFTEKLCQETILRRKRKTDRNSGGLTFEILRFRQRKTTVKASLKFFLTWTFVVGPAVNLISKTLFSKYALFGTTLLVGACHPGHNNNGGTRPRASITLRPFQMGEYIPKVSEQTIGASGPAEGPIYRDSEQFKNNLEENFNPDIIFKDEEKTNEDRIMTYHCMDRLNILAIMVIEQWPGVRLRVTEAWDDPIREVSHSDMSLHHEGRAVDVTTSDKDRSKYALLASLAVEAGFDWVRLKQSHVHCSVKSDSAPASKYGGCFPGDSLVRTPGGGMKRMDGLRPGDRVWSLDSSGRMVDDEVLTFIDIQHDIIEGARKERMFVSIKTETGKIIKMTRNHLIFKKKILTVETKSNVTDGLPFRTTTLQQSQHPDVSFAGKTRPGEFIYVANFSASFSSAILRPEPISEVNIIESASGAFAPLTKHGSIVVDDVVASCYAVLESHKMAHATMTPVRYFHLARKWLSSWIPFSFQFPSNAFTFQTTVCTSRSCDNDGVIFYAKALYHIGAKIIPTHLYWGD